MTRPLGSTPTAPSRGFAATTSRSAGTPRDGTHCLHGFSRSATPSRHPPSWTAVSRRAFPRSVQKPQTGLTSPTCRTPPGQNSGHPPDSSRADLLHPGFDATLLSNDTSTAIPENEDCAPSSRSPPDASRAPFPHRSPRRSSANAACGGLQPPSARAAAKGQTFISCTAPCQEALPTNRTPFHVRGTRRFSNSRVISRRGDLHRCWPSHAMSSGSVSNSCHFFTIAWLMPIFNRRVSTSRHRRSPTFSSLCQEDRENPLKKDGLGPGVPQRSSPLWLHDGLRL